MQNYSKRELLARAREQLARDYNCNPDDFLNAADTYVTPNLNDGRRKFRPNPPRFALSTFGSGTVISTIPEITDNIKTALADVSGMDIFAPEPFKKIEAALAKADISLYVNSIAYLPDIDFPRQRAIDALKDSEYTIKLYRKSEIAAFYPEYDKMNFHNALLSSHQRGISLRDDVICAAAYDENGDIASAAGASDDSELFWQIGIDTADGHRQRGLAAALVSLLTEEIIALGAYPYYCTWSANIFSQNTARKCGFFPAWNEAASAEGY